MRRRRKNRFGTCLDMVFLIKMNFRNNNYKKIACGALRLETRDNYNQQNVNIAERLSSHERLSIHNVIGLQTPARVESFSSRSVQNAKLKKCGEMGTELLSYQKIRFSVTCVAL